MKNILIPIILSTSLFSNNISGISYFNYSDDDGFGMSRTYFTYKKEISNNFSYILQTDVGQVGIDDRWTAYLKKAQADWLISSGIKLSMGLIGMNMFNIQEKTWGNRFISKSALDLAGWSSSADLGIGFYKNYGKFSTSLLMTNGEGYQNSDVDGKQKISLQVVYGEKRLDKNTGYNFGLVYSNYDEDPGDSQKVKGIFGGWSNGTILTGMEYYTMNHGYIDASLMSLSINYVFDNHLSVFIRHDNNENDITMAGFMYSPTKGLKICPNVPDISAPNPTFKINFEFKF